MKVGPLDFITPNADSLPWFPMRAWAVTDPAQNDLDAYSMTITEPAADKTSKPVHDLKRWLLSDKPDPIYWPINAESTASSKLTNARVIDPAQAAKRLLPQIFALGLEGGHAGKTYCLVPALNEQKRKAYTNVLQDAYVRTGELQFLSEPEMVLEYFRLIDGRLKLEQGKNSRVLVIDLGAGTTDFTIVTTRRDQKVTTASGSRARAQRVQAIPGSATNFAGQWVDEQIARQLKIELAPLSRLDQLRQIEQAKVAVASGGGDQAVGDALLTVNDLKEVAETLALKLEEEIGPLRERLWESLTGTAEALKLSEKDRDELGVSSSADAFKLIDTVVFAGGTSLLPGLDEHLTSLLGAEKAQVLRVGNEFAVVAAVGALAHVLWSKHNPKAIELPTGIALPPELDGGLSQSIELQWSGIDDDSETDRVIFPQGFILGPPPSVGEEVLRERQLKLKDGMSVTARFKPTEDPKGARPVKITATKHNPTVRVVRDSDNRLRLRSDGLLNAPSVFLDLNTYDKKRSESPKVVPEVPENHVGLKGTSDLIVDFGMSKIVLLRAATGLLSGSMIRAACGPGTGLIGAPTVSMIPPVPAVPPQLKVSPQLPESPQPSEPESVGEEGEPDVPEMPEAVDNIVGTADPNQPVEHSGAIEDVDPRPEPAERLGLPDDPPETTNGLPTAPLGPPPKVAEAPAVPPVPPPRRDASTNEAAGLLGPPAGVAAPVEGAGLAEGKAKVRFDAVDNGAQAKARLRWTDREPCHIFGENLKTWLASEAPTESVQWDLVLATIGLCLRDFVLIAGPPGCGKSSISRRIATGLGWAGHGQFRDVAVQAHWLNSDPLLPLLGLEKQDKGAPITLPHDLLVLFDEFNIARPEYYLTELFHRTAAHIEPDHRAPEHSLRAFGTLNIDDTSRPPSPKVLDRCFLVECSPRSWEELKKAPRATPSVISGGLGAKFRLADLTDGRAKPLEISDSMASIIRVIENAVTEHSLRSDLQPSLRVLDDLWQAEHLWREAGLVDLLPEPHLHDRLISGRLLTKIQGPADQVRPVVEALAAVVDQQVKDHVLPVAGRTHRRVLQFMVQLNFGFVSPWQ